MWPCWLRSGQVRSWAPQAALGVRLAVRSALTRSSRQAQARTDPPAPPAVLGVVPLALAR